MSPHDGAGRDNRPDHNTHRSLRQLVAVEAWFSRSEVDANRYTLHANVTFDEERLGGGEGSNVLFKLSVKKCEVVFLTPSSGYFYVVPSSVRTPRPLNPHAVQTSDTTTRKLGAGLGLSFSGTTPAVSGNIEALGSREVNKTIISNQEVSPYHELSKRSYDGHRSWSLDGRSLPKRRLWGPVWDAHNEPRLTIIDRRPDIVIQKDADMGFPPFSRIEVRCLREDIDIYDIEFKGEEEQNRIFKRPGQQARVKAAEAYLKQQILLEGLRVGEMSDRYSELTICDATIPIADASDLDG
ncbi:hypothetical protein [Paracoccus rhizosphaerae]|uniref:Uncharacterized protein n=1 Tax=Paracoccus rhizosphaerae TaxID=1133347 RepID=A0ABV6CK47_9RHOB|nr:hypothetical protein [Paracoccus rhizosphaerae]